MKNTATIAIENVKDMVAAVGFEPVPASAIMGSIVNESVKTLKMSLIGKCLLPVAAISL